MTFTRAAAIAAATLTASLLAACTTDRSMGPQFESIARGTALSVLDPTLPGNGEGLCPKDVDGWLKIDNKAGSASGSWGVFVYGGTTWSNPSLTSTKNTLVYDVNSGYTLQFCLKYSTRVDYSQIVGEATGSIVTGTGQDISHMSYRIVSDPPVNELQALTVTKGADTYYKRTVDWSLTKSVNGAPSVAFTGTPGSSFDVTWQVVATKTVDALSDYRISGEISVTNPNPVAVGVTIADVLDDGTSVTLNCPSLIVPAEESITCNYTASPTGSTATLNTATVTVDPSSYTRPANYIGEIVGGIATAAVTWGAPELVGDLEPVLTDIITPFNFDQAIGTTTTLTEYETFQCSTNAADYNANGLQLLGRVNTATLTFDTGEPLTASASVSVTCSAYRGETATGGGYPWSAVRNGTNNWFMYSPWAPTRFEMLAKVAGPQVIALDPATIGGDLNGLTVQKIPLIAGQQYVVGEITATVNGGMRSLLVTLFGNAKFANVGNNVKVHPMASCGTSQSYVQPGQYAVKLTAGANATSLPIPPQAVAHWNTAPCYAIHVDVLRFLAP